MRNIVFASIEKRILHNVSLFSMIDKYIAIMTKSIGHIIILHNVEKRKQERHQNLEISRFNRGSCEYNRFWEIDGLRVPFALQNMEQRLFVK